MGAEPLTTPITKVSWFKHPTLKRALQVGWISLVVVFIAIAIATNWETIRAIEWTAQKLSLIAFAIGATLLRRLAGGMRWVWLVKSFGNAENISTRESLRVYMVSNLATYIPGTYWFIAGRMVMNKKHGIGAFQTGIITLLEHFFLLVSGGLMGLLGLETVARLLKVEISNFWWIALVIGIGLVSIHPRIVQWLTSVLARAIRVEPLGLSLSYRWSLFHLLWSILIWLFGALSLLLLAMAFLPTLSLWDLPTFAAIYSVSWLIGFFTPFAPSGIGVREGVLGLAFGALGVSTGITLLVAALSRLLIIIEDLFWAAVGYRL